MNIYIKNLSEHLLRYYNIRTNEVESIIEDEWDYIEEHYLYSTPISTLAKDLVDCYMVA